jgi:hypothetical protein
MRLVALQVRAQRLGDEAGIGRQLGDERDACQLGDPAADALAHALWTSAHGLLHERPPLRVLVAVGDRRERRAVLGDEADDATVAHELRTAGRGAAQDGP